jgi:hypothetical protein
VEFNWIHSARRPLIGLLETAPGDYDDGDWQGKPKYSEKTRPSATLSTTNTTSPDPGSNPGPAVGSQRLTASAMARPYSTVNPYDKCDIMRNKFTIIIGKLSL